MPGRSLEGKVAIVTGAGCATEGIGNGRAVAILLALDGANVVCADFNVEFAETTVRQIKSGKHSKDHTDPTNSCKPGDAIAVQADVSVMDDCRKVVRAAVQTWGRVDILINNVGIAGPRGNSVDVDMEQWEKAMKVNVSSMVMMTKFAVPEMSKNTEEIKGSIVNLGSVAGLGGAMGELFYPTSKSAIINMTKSMAWQHGPGGIRVNAVYPGSVWTPLASNNSFMTEEIRQARASNNMLAIEGSGWDIGYAVRWLAGPEARWVTAVVLPVDAGLSGTINMYIPKFGK